MRLDYTSSIQTVQVPQELIDKEYLEPTDTKVQVSTGLSSNPTTNIQVFKCKKSFSIQRILVAAASSVLIRVSDTLSNNTDDYEILLNQNPSYLSSQENVLKHINFEQDKYYCFYTFKTVYVWWVWNFVENTN